MSERAGVGGYGVRSHKRENWYLGGQPMWWEWMLLIASESEMALAGKSHHVTLLSYHVISTSSVIGKCGSGYGTRTPILD